MPNLWDKIVGTKEYNKTNDEVKKDGHCFCELFFEKKGKIKK